MKSPQSRQIPEVNLIIVDLAEFRCSVMLISDLTVDPWARALNQHPISHGLSPVKPLVIRSLDSCA